MPENPFSSIFFYRSSKLTVSVHSGLDAFSKPASPTLIPMRLVDYAATLAFRFAGVLPIASDRALEKSSTAVTSVDSVMLA